MAIVLISLASQRGEAIHGSAGVPECIQHYQRATRTKSLAGHGQDAVFSLEDNIGSQVVTCEHRDTERYGRMVAVCMAGGIDLRRWLVQQGHALAYRKYSLDYMADEDLARAAKAGIWAGEFEDPASVRHPRR